MMMEMAMVSKLIRGVVVVLAGVVLACGSWPPLKIDVDDSGAYIDVRNLGEYGTSISRVSLKEASSSKVIWEVVHPNAPQIPGFRLIAGSNPVLPKHLDDFGFIVVVPSEANNFQLIRGTEYLIEVWDHQKVSSSVFSFHALTPENGEEANN